jgi:hypothetical protein
MEACRVSRTAKHTNQNLKYAMIWTAVRIGNKGLIAQSVKRGIGSEHLDFFCYNCW